MLNVPDDGEWSDWSPCTGNCGAATKSRFQWNSGQFCGYQTMACSPAPGQCEDTGKW